MNTTSCFVPAQILLPGEQIPLEQWGCIACDQFTSDPGYWARAEAAAGDSPSTLRLILPEVFLGAAGEQQRIDRIHQEMQQYARQVLTRSVQGFIYLERTLRSGRVRQGLVGCVDLEAYSYKSGAQPAVRPSEHTVQSRIPSRMKVRQGAALETPHLMLLADDPDCTLVEPIAAQKDKLRPVYEGELMLDGGHLAGWAVEDPALVAQIQQAVEALGTQATFDARYPEAAGRAPLTFVVGDGNHSLAAAKACWEELKKTLTPEQAAVHPARYCLAEVCNVRSDAIEIEPIHRVLFNVDCGAVLLSLISWADANQAGICFGAKHPQSFTLAGPHVANTLSFENPTQPLTVGTVEEFIEDFLHRHPEAKVDYVHDEPAVRQLCCKGGVAFLLPPFEKTDLFKGVVLGGVLPRKTFSMGHAEEKRYYIECRKIDPAQ